MKRLLLILSFLGVFTPVSAGWDQSLKAKKGKITVLWYESKPFIYKDASGKMKGIEVEILSGFCDFVRRTYQVKLEIEWSEARSFSDVFDQVSHSEDASLFGASALSMTPERRTEVNFSPAYLADISVLITSDDVPLMESWEEFYRLAGTLKAVTIRGTTYETQLKMMKEEGRFAYQFEYIPSSDNIIRAVERMPHAFGFIDLPVYMMMFNENPGIRIKRQNLFPVKREGIGIIYPLQSDWSEAINAYFNDSQFQKELESIKARYTDIELFHLMERLASSTADPLQLLAKEREIQSRELHLKATQISNEGRIRTYLILLIVVGFVSLVVIIALYQKSENRKAQIEAQRLELEERNKHLTELDIQKNNLVKILAHDMRSPINQVEGLSRLMLSEKAPLSDDQQMMIRHIQDASTRLNKMIVNILDTDALENQRTRVYPEPVVLSAVLHNVVQSFVEGATRKGIALNLESGDDKATVMADPLYILQVFENLVSNAVKFSLPGTTVSVRWYPKDGEVVAAVQDEGPGLSIDDQQLLFRKFQRLSARPTGGEPSTGLGLSIVKKYVELMSGRVWCESEVGKGTTFFVALKNV